MLFVVSLLPVAIYIAWVWSIDRFALVSARLLAQMILCGLMTALGCYGLFRLTGDYWGQWSDVVNPVVEEMVKAIPLLVLASRKRMVFFIDSVILGAAVGGGFSILENLLYLLHDDSLGFGTALFRGLEVSLVHMGCSAIVATALMFIVRQAERRNSRLTVKKADASLAILLLIASTALHVAHNALHFNPLAQTVTVIGLMALLLFGTYQYDSNQIHRWIDRSMNKQLDLLCSISEGRLDETPTGRYLLSVKESFPPEVFFDIVCYVQLHTELEVVAKSRFMAHEAGLEYPLSNESRASILAKHKEYQHLSEALGKTARITVAPLLKFYPADRKALDDLIDECRS